MTAIRIEVFRNAADLEALKGDFDRLAKGAVMQRLSWLLPWIKSYQSTHSLHVLVAYKGERVSGIFPLAETQLPVTGRSLVFMGSGKACSDDLGILVEPSDSDEIAESFATWLAESQSCCRWDHLDLDGVRESNRTMEFFGRCLESRTGSRFERKSSPCCWAASVEGGFHEYKVRLTKRARKIIRQAESTIDSGVATFDIAATLEQALNYLNEIERMHQARWQEQDIEGCFTSKTFGNFLRSAICNMWGDRWSHGPLAPKSMTESEGQRVHVGLLRIDGVPAAGCVCYRDRDALAMYLTGMNPSLAESRPGWMLNTCIIKHAIELGCTRFDFLRGDEEYKERLGGQPTSQHRWVIPANRLSSQVRNVSYRAAVNVKNWWNSSAMTPTR